MGLLEQDTPVTEQQEILEALRKVGSNLEATIRHLSEVITIDKSLNKNKRPLLLNAEVQKVLELVEHEIRLCRATITCDFSDRAKLLAVPAYLESIIQNLVTNALRYRHPLRAPEITIGHIEKENHDLLYVKDNGLGIDLKRHGDKLFKMYQTFHGHEESRGLELYLLKSQIEAMDGSVWVESEPKKGSTFYVKFRKKQHIENSASGMV